MRNLFRSFVFICCTLFIISCGSGDDAPDLPPTEEPQDAAMAFFDALYNQKDLKTAVTYVTPKMERIILHYKTAKAVQRHVLNLNLEETTMQIDDTSRDKALLDGKSTRTTVTIFFDGIYDGNNVRDMKTVKMTKVDNRWKIKEIKADNFN